jgi:hypothetical protein
MPFISSSLIYKAMWGDVIPIGGDICGDLKGMDVRIFLGCQENKNPAG